MYEKQTWENGDIITAKKMNHIENGLESVEKEQGPAGEPGFSPTIQVEDIPGGHKVTITDKEGAKEFSVINGKNGPDGNPIGTIISYMGETAPKDYLICDGAIYNISSYTKLAAFFKEQFGSEDFFGGSADEGTFAVPDMRNLFIRGYHGGADEQLSGDIGKKQEGTQSLSLRSLILNDNNNFILAQTSNIGESTNEKFYDSEIGNARYQVSSVRAIRETSDIKPLHTSRPVNMAVLYCIKATEAESYENVYSLEETVVGRWIDGKPIYRMVYEANISVSYNNPKTVCTIKDLEKLIDCHIFGENSDGTHCIAPSHGFSVEIDSGGTVVVTMGLNWAARFVKNSYFIIEYTKTTDEPTIEIPQTVVQLAETQAAEESTDLESMTKSELLSYATDHGVESVSSAMRKAEIIEAIEGAQA